MRLALLTNIPNPHQVPLFHAMQQQVGRDNVRLVFLAPVSEGREEMGWRDEIGARGIIRYWDSPQARDEVAEWIETADVVVQGRYPIDQVRQRILAGKLTFAYQERLWKKGFYRPSTLTRVYRLYRNYWSVDRANYHLLAAGAYAAGDVARLGCFKQRIWKFGYFTTPPELQEPRDKVQGPLRVVWCGRLVDVKQPRLAVEIIRGLIDRDVDVRLTMVGDGPERRAVEQYVATLGLEGTVDITGMVDSSQVGREMRNADILLFTSNRRDGWGVVVNEAMGHGCCVVASNQTGGPPWLIRRGHNGLLFDGHSAAEAVEHLARLAHDPTMRLQLAQKAHDTIRSLWSADVAAARLCELSQGLLDGRDMRGSFEEGPCSVAEAR